MTSPQWRAEAADRLRERLGGGSEADAVRIVAVAHNDDGALVTFRVDRDEHLFGRRVPWADVDDEAPDDWAYEAWIDLGEEFGTGASYYVPREQRETHIELMDGELPMDRRFRCSSPQGSTDRSRLTIYVNDEQVGPDVGRAALARVDGRTARIESLDVSPLAPVTAWIDLAYGAVVSAARAGFEWVLIESSLPEMEVLGFRGESERVVDTSLLDIDVEGWRRLLDLAGATALPRELLRVPSGVRWFGVAR